MSNDNPVKQEPEFKGWRAIAWPIHNFELKKFLPMGLMMLCILFIYTLVRDLKDTLVVSHAVGGGAGILGFLKLYCVMPAAILFMVVFVNLANKIEKEKLFYVIVTFFLCFFLVFGFVLYPLRGYLHFSAETVANLQAAHPHFHYIMAIIGNWSYSLFYIMAELWGSVVLTALFWQFANQITKVNEAKRFYSLFGFVGNFGLIASGSVIIICSNIGKAQVAAGVKDGFGANLMMQMGFVALFGALLIGIYKWMQKKVLTDPKLYTPGEGMKKKSKEKLGLAESFKCICTSPYLLMIAVLVLAYGVAINLFECVWKDQIHMQYPDSNDYGKLMGKLSLTTGILTILIMLVGANVLRRCKWRTAALVTPVFLLLASSIFFAFIMYENKVGLQANLFGYSVLIMAVILGLVVNASGKGIKYSLFDSTMQMAYIPLDSEMKTKGQAAVSVIGGRGGKSGGAAIQSTLLLIVGGGVHLSSLVEIIGSILFVIIILWIFSVIGLSPKFEALSAEKAKAEPAK